MKVSNRRHIRTLICLVAGFTTLAAAAGEAQAQFWGPGVYVIRSANTRKVLDVDSSWWRDHVAGMPLIQWDYHGRSNQRFRIEAAGGHFYTIRPQHSNQCLEIPAGSTADGTIIQQAPCTGSANQRFYIGYFPFVDQYNTIGSSYTNSGFSLSDSACRGDTHHNGASVVLCRFPYWERWVSMQFEFFLVGW